MSSTLNKRNATQKACHAVRGSGSACRPNSLSPSRSKTTPTTERRVGGWLTDSSGLSRYGGERWEVAWASRWEAIASRYSDSEIK